VKRHCCTEPQSTMQLKPARVNGSGPLGLSVHTDVKQGRNFPITPSASTEDSGWSALRGQGRCCQGASPCGEELDLDSWTERVSPGWSGSGGEGDGGSPDKRSPMMKVLT
jgi:hypothetical protein